MGFSFGERMVSRTLAEVSPFYARQRRNGTARQLNPLPYRAEYSGHKLHLDQNEKLGEYGVCHVIAVDGFSSKITAWHTMPVKNNLTIYEHVYKPTVLNHGIFDQIRVDQGKEFFLILYMQDKLKDFRRNCSRRPFMQTTSKKNHKVERLWVEINSRVNYPLKAALHELQGEDLIDMTSETTRFCVSDLTQQVSMIGMNNAVRSWNAHTIPHHGIPDEVFSSSLEVAPVPNALLVSAADAAQAYKAGGGRLTLFGTFGRDPLAGDYQRCHIRDMQFAQEFPDISDLMSNASNGNYEPFKNGILRLIAITQALS